MTACAISTRSERRTPSRWSMTANRTLLLIGLITPLTLGPALGADDQPARDGPVPQETPATPEIEHALPIGPGGLLPAAAADHPVGAEDLLEISVFEIPELNRTVRASERAAENIPVRGGDLLMNRNPELNLAVQPGDVVSVPIDRPIYIYVDGAVKTPGRLEELASRPITLLQAIAKAGGTTERASLKG